MKDYFLHLSDFLSSDFSRDVRCVLFLIRNWLFNSFAKLMELLILVRLLKLKEGERVCDIGCGGGTNDVVLALSGAHICGVDINKEALLYAKKAANRFDLPIDYLASDLGKSVGIKECSFDKVVSFCVLEHLENPECMLQEINRLLRPNGKLVLSADSFSLPNVPSSLKRRHRKHCHVQRYYRKEELERLLNDCGFEVETAGYFIKSRLSGFLYEMLLLAYLRTETVGGNSWPLRIFKVFCPVAFCVAVISDIFADEKNGGYWLALRATKVLSQR